MDSEDSSSNEDGGRMRGPVAIDDDDSEVSDGMDINDSAQTASPHSSRAARETVSRKVVQQLKDQVVSLKAQLYDAGKRESQWQAETKNAKNKYRQKIVQLQSRVVELESSQARSGSSDANASATHEAAVSTENQRLEELLLLERSEMQASREKIAELQTELQHMSSQNTAFSQKNTGLTNQWNNAKARLKDTRAENEKLKGELDAAHAQAADAAQRSTSPPPQRADKQQAPGSPGSPAQAQGELPRRYAKVQKQLELREERLEELESELQAAHAAAALRERHVKELELKVSDSAFQTEAQVRGLNVHIEELNESVRDAEERVRNLADINLKKGYDIADLQNAVRGWEEKCSRQISELRDLRASDAHLDQRVRDLAARARAGEEDCRRLQDKLTECDGHIVSLQRDIDKKNRAINDVRRAATIPAEAGNAASSAGPGQEAYAQLLAVKEKVSKGFQPLPDRLLSAKQAVAGSNSQQEPLSLPSLKNLLDTVEATAAAVNGAIRGGFPNAGLLRSLCGVTDAGGNPLLQPFALVAGYYVYHANHAAVEAAEKDQAIDAILAEVAAISSAQQHAPVAILEGARSGAGAGVQALHGTGAQSPDDGTACSEMSLGSGDDLQPPAKQPRLQLELPQAVQDTARDPRLVKLRASPPTAPAADAGTDAALLQPAAVLGAAAADSPAAVVSPLATLGKRAYSSVAEGSGEGPYTSVCITGEISPGRAESLANRVGPVYVFRTLSAHRFLVVYTSAELARRAVSALNGHLHKGRTMISCQPHWEGELTNQLPVVPRTVFARYPIMSQAAVMTALGRYGRVLSMYSAGEEYMALFADATTARTAADSLNCTMLAGKPLICKHLPSLPPVDRAKWTEYYALVWGQPAGTDDDGPSEEPSPKRPDNREVTMPPSAQQIARDDLDLLWQRRHAMCSIQATVTLYVMIRHQTLSRDALCAELSKFGTVVFMTQKEDRYLAGFNNAEAAVGASRGLSNTFTEGKVITCRHFPKLPLVEKVTLLPGYTELELSRAFEGPTGLCVEKVEYCEILADLMREPVLRISPSMFTAAQQYVSYIDSVLADNNRSRSTTSEPKQLSSPKSSWRDASPPRTSAVRTTTAPQTFTCTLPPCSTAASSGGGKSNTTKSNTTVAKAAKRYCTICAERGLGKVSRIISLIGGN
jgi:hypothetical protein